MKGKKMKLIKKTSILLVLLSISCMVSGCFTHAVDKAYLGYTAEGALPVYENTEAGGYFLLPFALVLDVGTLPLQGLVLAFAGDDSLYDPFELGLEEHERRNKVYHSAHHQ